MSKKFYKTVFRIEVLNEDENFVPSLNIGEIAEQVIDGECSGHLEVVSNEEIIEEQMITECKKHGSDPSFFEIGEDDIEMSGIEEIKWDLELMRNSPVTRRFMKPDDADLIPGWTGNIIYKIEGHRGGQLFFFCGPEVEGWMYDQSCPWVDDVIRSLFKDMDVEAGAAESYHIIDFPDNDVNGDELALIVKDRLEKAGAVKMLR